MQGLSRRELLSLHAEVLVLMKQLNISYMDAAHRLYLAEIRAASDLHRQCSQLRALATESNAVANVDLRKYYAKMSKKADERS